MRTLLFTAFFVILFTILSFFLVVVQYIIISMIIVSICGIYDYKRYKKLKRSLTNINRNFKFDKGYEK